MWRKVLAAVIFSLWSACRGVLELAGDVDYLHKFAHQHPSVERTLELFLAVPWVWPFGIALIFVLWIILPMAKPTNPPNAVHPAAPGIPQRPPGVPNFDLGEAGDVILEDNEHSGPLIRTTSIESLEARRNKQR